MIKKSFSYRFILTVLLAMALLLVPLAAVYAQDTSSSDTKSRGYQLIDGDVYDLHGNLLIKMHDGFTADGYTLDPNFTVYDASTQAPDDNTVSPDAIYIYNGTKYLYLNVDGNQGIQLGNSFTVSSSAPDVQFAYVSGTPSGVNFGVTNITRDTVVAWVHNIRPGRTSQRIPVYNASNDSFVVKGSAEGSAGNATVVAAKL